jgi:hypothetical protein
MPVTSRLFVKASIIYLCLGAILGALMFINRWIPLGAWVSYIRVSHVEMLIVGWLTQLILGVAWWLFPPLKIGLRADASLPIRRGQTQRGSEPLFWVTFALLNTAVLIQSVVQPLYTWSRVEAFHVLTGISGVLLLLAAIAFVINMWGRVRELGR